MLSLSEDVPNETYPYLSFSYDVIIVPILVKIKGDFYWRRFTPAISTGTVKNLIRSMILAAFNASDSPRCE